MKSFFNRIVSGLKTKRVAQQKSLLDGSDYISIRPEPPKVTEIRTVVADRLFKGQPPPASDVEASQRASSVNSLVFDLTFRCCGAGRCIFNDLPCRFPACFGLRPLSKGAEIKQVRGLYEIKSDAVSSDVNNIIDVALTDHDVNKAEKMIRDYCSRKIRVSAYGRRMSDEYWSYRAGDHLDEVDAFQGHATQAEANPLNESEELREEVVSLYIWRASLLVNSRKDVAAVNSLLNLSTLLPLKFQTRCLLGAAQWAFYNDKEVIFYRSFIQRYPSNALADHMANNRPMTMRRVFEHLERLDDPYFADTAIDMIVAKEVLCIVTSAQAAQINRDESEDPMKSSQIPLTVHYFRFHVTPTFWSKFLNKLLLPPMPPPSEKEEATDPSRELGITPRHILDAMGRSMVLHHLLKLSEQRDKDIASGAVFSGMATQRLVHDVTLNEVVNEGLDMTTVTAAAGPDEFAPYVEQREGYLGKLRLRQLLELVREYEMQQQAAIGGNSQFNLLGVRQRRQQQQRGGPGGPSPSAGSDTQSAESPARKE